MLLINLFVALPLIIANLMAYSSYSLSIEQSVGKYQGDAVSELNSNLDTYLNELNLLSMMPYQAPNILHFLASHRTVDAPLTLDESDAISSFINQVMVNGRVDVVGLYLYGMNGASYVLLPESIGTTNRTPEKEAWYERALASNLVNYMGPHQVKSSNGAVTQVISIVRKIRSIETGKLIGYFALDINMNAIEGKVSHLAESNFGSIAIADDSGKPVYKDPGFAIPSEHLADYRGSGSLIVSNSGQKELLTYVTSELTGWTTIVTVPMRQLLQDTVKVRNTIVFIEMGCLFAAILISIWLSVFITRPISQLRNSMKKVERGDLSVSIPLRSSDELGQLSQTFNLMVSRLNELGFRLYESELREKHSQIAALQNQINPHFLYNTLGSISMYAEIQGNAEVVEMTNNLSSLLRYSISSDQSDVTLGQELAHVEGYMAIQQIRYGPKLQYVVGVAPDLLSNQMLRLSLQPLVENCIIHGLERGRGKGSIRITGHQLDGDIELCIEDDGKGMRPEQLIDLLHKLQDAPMPNTSKIGGHGLVNVHRRIALRFGEKYGIRIESEVTKGTKIVVRLPLLQNKDDKPTHVLRGDSHA
jgi:two-component system sensor histidine kinase YesM